jgi:hypothetical protein
VQAELKTELQAQRKEAIRATRALYKNAQRTVRAVCKRQRPQSTDDEHGDSSPKRQSLDTDDGEYMPHIYLPHDCT